MEPRLPEDDRKFVYHVPFGLLLFWLENSHLSHFRSCRIQRLISFTVDDLNSYREFGYIVQTDDVLPSLEEQGVRQLYPKGPNVGMLHLQLICDKTAVRV